MIPFLNIWSTIKDGTRRHKGKVGINPLVEGGLVQERGEMWGRHPTEGKVT